MTQRIYLDHAATTPCRPEVVAAMLPALDVQGYNPSSHHAEGRRARIFVDEARERIAHGIGARPREIVFTGSGSEADATAVIGVARARRAAGRHVVTAATEHRAVLAACEALAHDGWEVTIVGVDADGRVDEEAFAAALRDNTVLATIMLANNELGTIAPIARLAALARRRGVIFHSDAVQAPGKIPLDVDALGVDLLSLSAHKFYGPKGVGVLYMRDGTPLEPLILGGGQEGGRRAGTENVAGIVGAGVALELAVAERPEAAARIGRLRDAFERRVRETIPGVAVHGAGAPRLPNHSNLAIQGVESEALLVRLDLEGIAVSGGSACAAGSTEPSHVIAALATPAVGSEPAPAGSAAAVRFSFGRTTTPGELESVLARLPGIVADMREFPAFVGTS